MPLNTPTILPPNSTAPEKGLADVAWRLNSPPDVAQVIDADSISADLLPWLAWSRSVDAWNLSETDGVKRASVTGAAQLHRLKGTVEGFRRLCSLFGATLAAVQRPPHKTFCGKSYTRAERDSTLSVYPQLRIRSQAKRARRYAGGIYFNGDHLGNGFAIHTDAATRMVPQVYYSDRGAESEIATYHESATSDGYIRVCVSAVRKYATFCGAFQRFTSDCGAAARIYSFSTTYEYTSTVRWKTLLAGLDPTSVFPEMTYESSTRAGLFCGPRRGRSFVGQPLVRTDAENRIYKRIYLFDASRALESHGKSTFVGAMRLGMPAYTAELQVKWPGMRAKRAMGRFVDGYLITADHSLFDRFVTALGWAKSARDKALLDTYSHKPLTAGEIHTASTDMVCGQLISRF
jgi:phage tail P2-like protein